MSANRPILYGVGGEILATDAPPPLRILAEAFGFALGLTWARCKTPQDVDKVMNVARMRIMNGVLAVPGAKEEIEGLYGIRISLEGDTVVMTNEGATITRPPGPPRTPGGEGTINVPGKLNLGHLVPCDSHGDPMETHIPETCPECQRLAPGTACKQCERLEFYRRAKTERFCFCRLPECEKLHDPCRDTDCYHTTNEYPPGGSHHSPECLLGPSPTFNHPNHGHGERRSAEPGRPVPAERRDPPEAPKADPPENPYQ